MFFIILPNGNHAVGAGFCCANKHTVIIAPNHLAAAKVNKVIGYDKFVPAGAQSVN